MWKPRVSDLLSLKSCVLSLGPGRREAVSRLSVSGTFHGGSGLDVAQICGHSGRMSNIVEGQAAHQGTVLEEKRKGLPDPTGSPQHGYFSIVLKRGTEKGLLIQNQY